MKLTLTQADHITAKIGTDLKRIQRLYGQEYLNEIDINNYIIEILALILNDYLDYARYGFQRDGCWIEPTLEYTMRESGKELVDDSPGKIKPRADISGAKFTSFIHLKSSWWDLDEMKRERFKWGFPFRRKWVDGIDFQDNMKQDRVYSVEGFQFARSTLEAA